MVEFLSPMDSVYTYTWFPYTFTKSFKFIFAASPFTVRISNMHQAPGSWSLESYKVPMILLILNWFKINGVFYIYIY